MLRSDERAKKEEAVFAEMAKLESKLEDLKAEKMAFERENAKLQARVRQLETQIETTKQERDRLLEISSDLKVQVTQSEKRKYMQGSAVTSQPQTERRAVVEPDSGADVVYSAPATSLSTQQERRRANVGGVLTYGNLALAGISEDKHADLVQLQGEVN